MTEIQKELIDHKEREKRLIKEFEQRIQDIHKDYETERRKFETRITRLIPDTVELRRNNLMLIKTHGINGFGIGRKDQLEFTHYVRGKQVVELPDEHKRTFKVILIAYFDTYKKIKDFGTLNRNHSQFRTYHSRGTHTCLGEDKRAFEGIDPDKPDTIHKALDYVKETIEVLNPYSPLVQISENTRNLRPTIRYVNEQMSLATREQRQAREGIERRRQQSRLYVCRQCGQDNIPGTEVIRRDDNYFCSDDCEDEYWNEQGRECQQCGNNYYLDDSNASDTELFCCDECEDNYNYDNEEQECTQCGGYFLRGETSADDNEFCSRTCEEQHEREQNGATMTPQQTNQEIARNPTIANIIRQADQQDNNQQNTRAWR